MFRLYIVHLAEHMISIWDAPDYDYAGAIVYHLTHNPDQYL